MPELLSRSGGISSGTVSLLDGTIGAPSLSFASDPDTGLFKQANNAISIVAGGVECFRGSALASAVNFISVTPAATGTGPIITAAGADANIGLNLLPKGAGRVGIGTTSPNAPLEVLGAAAGTVGGFAAGHLQVRTTDTNVFANAVITGHSSEGGGNKQLWYLGSASGINDDITLTNRQNGALSFATNNATRMTISAVGTVQFPSDQDVTTGTGGVFKFTDTAFRAGLDAVEYIEIGHGGGNAFIDAVGDGGLDIRFEGATLATFTDFGHLHLQTNVDQKHTLKIITANNVNDTGFAWENSGGAFTATIFRTDIGGNRADLVFAAGQNVDIDLLTNSFKIHGSAANSGRLEVLGSFQISSGGPGLDKVLKSDATGLATWGEDLGTVVAQETFASSNVRFFGELALPAAQGWTDVATGSATIDLQTQLVFGVSKQVVRHNDNTTNGATTSSFALTTQNWSDINAFGASYSGVSRLDTNSGIDGFFSGLQANAAENPLATGNRRYGLLFDLGLTVVKISEADNPGNTVQLDGTGGRPFVAFDEWFSWECVVPPGLGPAQFFVNGALTNFAPQFRVNGGGLGTAIKVGSGSTAGANRIVYHENFGITIFEDAATRTLLAATMGADIAQVNIPEGRRDYTITLPDGNPRELGSVFRVVANNLFGKITLENQNPAAPEILYNGLRTLVIDVFTKEIIGGINTVDQGNVYVGFKAEDIDRANSIFAQLSSSVDQVPVDTNPTVVTYNRQDDINGIGHSTTVNPGELQILAGASGVYFVSPQSQVGKDSGATKTDIDTFWQVDRGGGFQDELNSNAKLTIKDSDITDVNVSAFTVSLNAGDRIRMMQRVSTAAVGLGLKNTNAEVGPPTIPRTPSIILTIHRVGGV